ncbi:MAG: hypothetical protein PHN79_10510 [Methanoregula sp.]|nr:hypothetical protein [Methanoregula sp.]
MLTSWFTGVTRGTVINHEPKDLNIPPRVSLIITNIENVVNESEDGQDESRFLTLEVRRTPDDMKQIREFIQRARPDIQTELELIQVCWNLITLRTITLHKKIEKDLPIREFKRFLTLCQARALLCNRDTTTDEDIDAMEKFLTYSKPMINSTTPGFTRKESAVFGCLTGNWKTVNEIVKGTGMTMSDVYRALRGREGSFQQPRGGLMSKEPQLEHIEEHSDTENNIHLFRLIPTGE